jgi:hypothetical protein
MSNGDGGGEVDTVSNEVQQASVVLSEPVVYVGPLSTKLGLSYSQIYNELTDVVKNALDANPALGLLLVPISQYSAIKYQVGIGGDQGYITHAIELLVSQGVL